MTARLNPADHDWMTAPATRRVMNALETAAPGGSRFVGGCVRNALLGEPVADIDIATVLEPDAAAAALEAAGIAVHPTGLAHGTITAVANHQPFEVTTLRRDVSTDGRRATVAFTTDWAEDAARRDFTINALYANEEGEILDLVGGLKDIPDRRIVFIGKPEDRIAEDYLRILRFFRFFAWYGKGEPDAAGLAACAAMTDGLSQLSAERIWMETKKLLAAPDPARAIELMAEAGVAQALYGTELKITRLSRLIELGGDEPLLRLAALLPDRGVGQIRKLKLSNEEAGRLRKLADGGLSREIEAKWPTRAELEKLVYRHGNQAIADQLFLLFAETREPPEGWGGAIGHVLSFAAPEFPVTGADLKKRGLSAGPEMGQLLRRLEEEWIESRFRLDKHTLLGRL
ncbi:CCA tRNA nucleotidyltransferase [Hyphobacterium sp.]|uniref:CCA tRNA nucleotidyltransferase n=1 Tax=Hyphobacterium sp. TaxID=2004662 RepID=UPI003BAB8A61